jgi:flagellar motility protein MotE (MotC chaperone)
MSIICAIALSMLSMIIGTGRIPFKPAPPEPGTEAATTATEQAAAKETLSIFSEKGKAVDDLIVALNEERDLYVNKKSSLDAEAREVALQMELLSKLKGQLDDIRENIDIKTLEIEGDEEKNLKRLAEVYGKMDPESAAAILLEMDKERAAKVLYLVTERSAAAIFDAAVGRGPEGVEIAAEWADIIRRMEQNNGKK